MEGGPWQAGAAWGHRDEILLIPMPWQLPLPQSPLGALGAPGHDAPCPCHPLPLLTEVHMEGKESIRASLKSSCGRGKVSAGVLRGGGHRGHGGDRAHGLLWHGEVTPRGGPSEA